MFQLNRGLLASGLLALVVLGGCGGAGSDARPTAAPSAADAAPAARLPAGEWSIAALNGAWRIHANAVARSRLLTALARRAEFELVDDEPDDDLVSLRVELPSLAALVAHLVGERSVELVFAEDDALERRLARVLVKPAAQTSAADLADSNPGADSLDLGSSDYAVDLAERLRFGSDEERVLAVRELRMTPREFAAAVAVFESDPAPEVRRSVLELLRFEPNFRARTLMVDALQDTDDDVVAFALESLAQTRDFSLLGRLRPLTIHGNPEIRARATELTQSLAADYPDT
ncbi:MAG: hypothetical protein AAF515_08475 [Pseudomonadota bacterium]